MVLQQLHIGQLTSLKHEALAPYESTRAVVIAHDADSQMQAAELAEGIGLQLMEASFIKQVRLALYEATPSRSYAQIKRLLAESGGAVGEQFYNGKDCVRLLVELDELAHRRYALLAATGSNDLAAYNALSSRPESTHILIITALEALSGDPHTLQALENLCLHGPTVGILPILLRVKTDAGNGTDSDFRRKPIEAFWHAVFPAAWGLDLRGGGVEPLNQPAELWRLFRRFQIQVGLETPLRARWVDKLLEKLRGQVENDPNQDFLRIPIGMEGAKPAHFCLGEASNVYHGLIGGATRSGKSTLLNNLILQSCEANSPDTLRLWLFDYREGVEFTLFQNLAHVDVLHVDNDDRAGAIAAFAAFEGLMKQRARLFRECDPPVSRLVEYNQHNATPLPRCLLIVDEAQSLFDDRECKPHAKRLLREVSRKGAAFGLHILLSTQSYQNVELEPDVKGQFRLRLGLQLSSSMECRALMGRDNDAPLTLSRHAAIYNANFGEARDNRLIHLADLPKAELMQRLKALRQRHPDRPPMRFHTPPPDPKTRQSNDFADWDDLMK